VLRGRCVSRGLPAGGRQFVDQPMRVGRDPRQHTAEVLKEDHTPTHTAIGWTSTTTALSPPSTGIRNTPSGGIAQGRVPRLLNSTPTPPAGPVYPLSGVPPRIGRGSPVASASEARPPVLASRSGGPLADVITSDARITLHGTAPCAPSIVRHATQTTASKSPTPSPAIQTPASTLPNPQTPTPHQVRTSAPALDAFDTPRKRGSRRSAAKASNRRPFFRMHLCLVSAAANGFAY
jgi:hypothetical protein